MPRDEGLDGCGQTTNEKTYTFTEFNIGKLIYLKWLIHELMHSDSQIYTMQTGFVKYSY
jgi:hypothetical protein